jgi:lysyl-tRNA synthetase class 1
MDEYLTFAQNFNSQDKATRLDNPAFYIHNGKIPDNYLNFNLSYSLLLNLASACNPENDAVLWGFISKYQAGLTKQSSPMLANIVDKVINYYNDFIKKNKKYRTATATEKSALQDLANSLQQILSNPADISKINDSSELQNLVFQIGKNHGYEKNMREWFLAMYQILLGQDQGPRMGSFIELFGVDNFVNLIAKRVEE